ncbi:MAG: signal peptide peptidase SppA [Flavobacteriaceae bacterium]|nr:signal peptide peptidase SppA [Flavobacteriaceae bacterium]
MNFTRSFFASVLGTLTAFGLLFVILLLIISATASIFNASTEVRTLSDNSILNLDLNLPIVERPPVFDEIQSLLGLEEEVLGLPNILSAIQIAAENPKIQGIRLRSDFISSGWAQTHSIRKALKDFKSKDKFIYAYGDVFTQKGYFLASVADSIFLNPVGALEFKGLASEILYYKDFQDKYGFKMEVVRHGKYKSAVEPFLENEMSAENKFQIHTLLNDIWSTLREEISISRDLLPETLDAIVSSNKIAISQDAVSSKLIDGLAYEDVFDEKIKTRLGLDIDEKLKKVSINSVNSTKESYDASIKDRIAVVFAKGPILYGEGSESIIAQGIFVETLEELSKDDWIKAVVLRVDSPGGSALTSELIWRTIEKLKKSKPVIVSMGNVAASGGYYIAAGADHIFADPLSITGSIGVFATLPNVKGFLDDIGIQAQSVETHPNALGYSPFQTLNKSYEQQMISGIENIYDIFKERVIQGRELSPEAVENLAQGRVWSGKQALKLGLIDDLGDLQDAITLAANDLDIEDYNVIEYPKFEDNLENMLKGITPSLELRNPLKNLMPEQMMLILESNQSRGPSPYIQTLLPFELRIH